MPEEVGKPIVVSSIVDGRMTTSQLEFLNVTMGKRRLIRSFKNPMDRSTIVSIFPKDIMEEKPTIEPGKFKIPAGSFEKPAVLTIGSSSWWKDIDPDQPMLEMQRSSIEVANSVVVDYCNSMLGSNMGDTMPGLFFVLGEHSSDEIRMKYKTKLEEVKAKQINWYKVLVKLADSLWARTQGNSLAIWDEMRLAARELNFNDKPWLKDYQISELVRCNACGGMRNPQYPICPSCKAIDQSHPYAKEIKFAI